MQFKTRILLLVLGFCFASSIGCGDYPSSDYSNDSESGLEDPSCKMLASDLCNSCFSPSLHSEIYLCELNLERECRYAFCDNSINRSLDKCNEIFSLACQGEL